MRVWAALMVLVATGASAEDARVAYAGDGTIFEIENNASGAVLTSRYPKAIFTEAGALSSWEIRPVTVYLGKDCDAVSDLFGEGTWDWANGGFVIRFGGFSYVFPRQGHPVDAAGIGCPMQ